MKASAKAKAVMLLLAVLLLVPAMRAEAAGTSGSKVVYVKGGGYTSVHTSDIVTYDANNIVIAWRAEYSPDHRDMGDIMYAYSSDGGATWSAPGIMAQHDASWSYANVTLYNDNGTLYAFMGKTDSSLPSSDSQQLLVAKKSTDKGHTWVNHYMTRNYDDTAVKTVLGGKIYKSGSNYLLPYHGGGQGLLRSANLKDWYEHAFIPDPGVGLQEGFVTASYFPNTLWMVMRTNASSGGFAYSSTSTDGGLTWTAPAQEAYLPNFNSKAPVTTTADNQYVYLYNDDSARSKLYFKTKRQGQPWSEPVLFADKGTAKDEYPAMIEYEPGKFYTSYNYNRSEIVFKKLDVNPGATAAYLHMEAVDGGQTPDASGNDNHLTVFGAEVAAGKSGNALRFDNQDYAEIADGTGLSAGTGDFSVSLWAKPDAVGGSQMFLLWYGDAVAGASQWWLRAQSDGGIYFMTAGGGSEKGTGGSGAFAAGQWTHIVAKREANLLKLYMNGEPYSSATVPIPFNVNGDNTLRIGKEKSGASRPWAGLIDEVQIFDYALSDEQAAQLYESTL
ncbi:sialidase family protein [Paenibacillus arenilitoris]|uniref:Exo-alpha-sialidase n=1 Tax=Paenibacillus arenilitoris TaxID=2772299 RepID=A0A927CPM5_9BACL|nr:sialidase family protein [Paenibacillus arenilitoris]MBD2871859.1 exo-alpha-sialidase [Paenibacillus arenilitoris]